MSESSTRAAAARRAARAATASQLGDGYRFGRPVRRWAYHRLVRLLTLLYSMALAVAKTIGQLRPPRTNRGQLDILLTGRFESGNWAASHLRPLAASERCSRVLVVSTFPVPEIAKVQVVYPPAWLQKLIGATASRLALFAWLAMRKRPDIVGGFHIKANGLLAGLVAPLVRARSMYFSVGGIPEVLDGGIWGEGKLFERMETPDGVVERRLIRAVGACDFVITMGTRAADFFRHKGGMSRCYVISGGIDSDEFCPSANGWTTDLILVGRLAEIKRVDLFLHTVKCVSNHFPGVTAMIVGDGHLRGALEQLARDLGISDRVCFAGHQNSVGRYLRQARVFLLTSRSEGLSLAMMEAMMCGLPAIVPNVGDLADLVEDRVNGYLVDRPSPDEFASRAVELLSNSERYLAFAHAARQSALRYNLSSATRKWNEILAPQA